VYQKLVSTIILSGNKTRQGQSISLVAFWGKIPLKRFKKIAVKKKQWKAIRILTTFTSHYLIHDSIHGRFFLNEMKSQQQYN
jgi:hypothetical protein